ncbi:transcription mediator subunit med12 [Colletotrichum truncatum]|uniref:Transcription mediator subunit med12 n=1 Tax=Colletotrichum truncatum TaxID=5467 RepID=A0ACC3Z1J8_COLTU|nr:transcription mediator subunit med12 [Colletotrichum truncatum]XP_036580811.1 transcription mediator subunit med12 [Colletotrichum truncatum]KAF6780616.1 transcription mediator subunit med12 [Colletotrichum truncatum]KAF6788883.1 transcription mediator subunit med12 [Colletotrichum truncatum]
MTSRTPMGVQPRPPQQRTLSSSGLSVQRPTHQRTLSAQYLPQSPVRKENLIDLTGDANDVAAAQNRYGTLPRRGGSRLKLELSNDAMLPQHPINDSPKTLTPSRLMPKNETSNLTDMSSPASTKGHPIDADNPPMPMPKRRPRFVVPAAIKDSPTPVVAIKKDGRPKPYHLETPATAPRYAPFGKPRGDATTKQGFGASGIARDSQDMGYADFFPWTGNHPEDQWSETIIKNGYFDKPPATTTETSSAKAALFPALKHKSGLNLLSNIFVGVLNQRKLNGQISSPSTFKPPPRVTLTDTKREMWLRDLANPSISLRRLSRTIPHGIRGKVLLDHCLNKNVPTERAVWLVKCVGANEIRAFKRKGNGPFVLGGEAKWLRDWTVFVEQFVEGVSTAFGDNEWKAKVQYAIRLATHLYAEHLVDRDHYMDWLVSGLENSTQSKLPMWILITQIYWKDLLRLRRYGRRLVNALLSHLNTIHNDPDRDILIQLSMRLTSLLIPLLSSHPDNFVAPSTWFKYRDALLASIQIDNEFAQNAYRSINTRNEQLVASANNSQPANRQILVRHLDTTFQTLYAPDLAAQCWAVSEDKGMIVRTLLEWCTSPHRPGAAKVYITASLLRTWIPTGLDVTTAILEFLSHNPPMETNAKKTFHKLVSEIVRSGDFQFQGYIFWLIARGGLRKPSDTDAEGSCATRLLVDLPLHALNSSSLATRASLLRRASYDVNDEAEDIETALKCIQHALGLPLPPGDPILQRKPVPLSKLCRLIANSNRALQTEVGARLLQIFTTEIVMTKNGPQVSAPMFNLARAVLEAASDYSMLAEIVKVVIRVSNPDLLASCADTINVHLPIFAALGLAKELFDVLMERLKVVGEEQGIAARPLLASLANLAARLPGLTNTAAHLRKELHQCDRNTAIDACSPVSDNMAAQLQDAEGELHEEIEKLLTSGSSVDRPTMDRLFQTVVGRLESSWANSPERQRAYSALLGRLRIFDTQHFDLRMTDWVHHVSTLKARPGLADIYPLLISIGCLTLPILLTTTTVDASRIASNPSAQVNNTTTYMQEVLQLTTMPLAPKTALTPEESYRFYIQQRMAPRQSHKDMVVLVRNALVEYSRLQSQSGLTLPLANPNFKNSMLELLRTLVLLDAPAVVQALGIKTPEPALVGIFAQVTTKLLVPGADDDAPLSFETVLELANEFTLPFCQVKLSIGLPADTTTSPGGGEQAMSQFDMFSRAMDRAVSANNVMWTSMLPYLNEEVTEHLKRQAHLRFLGLFPSQKNPPSSDPLSEDSIQLAGSLLSVVEAIVRGRPAPRTSQLTSGMVEKLTELWEILAARGDDKRELRTSILRHWLPALLRFITLHTNANEPVAGPSQSANMKPPTSAAAFEIRGRILIVLSGLTLELDNLALENSQAGRLLGQQIFDLALLLVDSLPEETRLQCVRVLLTGGTTQSPASSDARLRYLFSQMPPPTEQFVLAHRQQPATQPTGPPRPKIPISMQGTDKLTPFVFRKWEMLSEPTPNVGENDTALSLTLFEAIKIQ